MSYLLKRRDTMGSGEGDSNVVQIARHTFIPSQVLYRTKIGREIK